jgi:2-iminobutanoate/2-iminopropanoate deaminase
VRQKAIEVPGLSHHGAPIPTACRVGPILVTSRIMGKDPDTGHMPSDPDSQAELCFKNLKRVLEAGGMDMGDVVKLTVYLVSDSYRTAVNKPWNDYYPDPAHRPTRDSLVMPLRGANLIQIEAWAIAKELG